MSNDPQSVGTEEFELKLLLPPKGLEKLRRSPLWRGLRDTGVRELHSTYYDSADRRLLKNGFTLRVRRSGEAAEQTLKWDGAGGRALARREWRWPLASSEAAVEPLAAVDPLAQVADFDPATLRPLCDVVYRRAVRLWEHDGTTLEVALDAGAIEAEAGSESLSELEIELKSGDPAAVFALARSVNDVLPVSPSTESKGERGLTLPADGRAAWHKPGVQPLDPAMSLDDVLAGMIGASLAHLSKNLACARQGSHEEGVHQVRVAVRRLRAVLKLFKAVLPGPRERDLDVRLRDLARALGPVRDLDVFRNALLAGAQAASPSTRAVEQIDRMAAKLQANAQAEATRALTSPEFGRLVIDLHEWRALRRWREQPVSEASALLFQPAQQVVGQRLERLHGKVVRRGKGFAGLEADARHELRIQVKRLRYAVDLFGALYDAKKVKRYRTRVSRVQDQLGNNNDAVMAEGVIRQLLLSRHSLEFTLAAGAVLGWLRCAAQAREGSVVEDWAAFRAAAKPWR